MKKYIAFIIIPLMLGAKGPRDYDTYRNFNRIHYKPDGGSINAVTNVIIF